MLGHIIYILAVVAVAIALPENVLEQKAGDVVIAVGLIGIWRYSWGLLHYVRSLIFRFIAFPKIRRRAAAAVAQTGYGHAYLMITSFRIDAQTTARVYRAAFEAALAAPGGATVVASIVESGDHRLIENVYRAVVGDQKGVKLVSVRIPGTGKRDGLTHGFKAIAKLKPGENDTVSVIDGDSIVPPDLVEKCAGIFLLDKRIGALTTDENCIVEGREIFRQWYSLRFAQRQVLMCSMGLAKRVLTLTGRMSMFRATLVCQPSFYDHINQDFIEHWRLGRIKMLTGDDKSSWFWMLKHDYLMYYVPDVIVHTVEQPPLPGFVESARVLMIRWFGNMLRTNSRALRLGPWKIGLFNWIAVFDQRISMWTCLSGLFIAVMGTVFVSPLALLLYILWVATSRYVLALTLLSVRPSISISYPFLLYFNQIFGSFIKVYVQFRLDRQSWTRQKTKLESVTGRFAQHYASGSTRFMSAVAITVYVALIAYVAGVFPDTKSNDQFQALRELDVESVRSLASNGELQ